jgi:carboxymethylenebutenolidase
MWNSYSTDQPEGVIAGVTSYSAGGGDLVHAYVARPEGPGPFPGVVLVMHGPGWDEFLRESSRRLAAHGFTTICPDLYCREGHGKPEDMAAKLRAEGGVADDRVVADMDAAQQWLKFLPTSNGKVGIVGMCSAGRHAVLTASRTTGFSAVADLWGGVVQTNLTAKQPVAPIDLTPNLNAPMLGLFGNDDRNPTPAEVDQHEAALQAAGKTYTFHRYDGAGHGFFYYHNTAYRPQAAMDGWNKLFAFFDQSLGRA